MTLRLSEKLDSHLDVLARSQGVSKHQLIIRAIESYVAQVEHGSMIARATSELLDTHRGLLDDLSKT